MDWNGWEEDVLAAGGWPSSSENVLFMQEWGARERSACSFNPLNTTLRLGGSRNCVQTQTAGVWVQAYTGTRQGTAATLTTLSGPLYPNIRAALASGDPYSYPGSQAVAADLRTWGSTSFADFYLTQTVTGRVVSPPGQGVPPGGLSAGVLGVQASGHRGYQDLRWTLAKHLPNQLTRSQRAGAATLRALARRSKVGR